MRGRLPILAAVLAAMAATALVAFVRGSSGGVIYAAPAPVTWRRQIAPLVYKNCSSCHHDGGSGPFSLVTFADARRWGGLMETVTASRYMPPWLPSPEHGRFEGDRRLKDEDVALVKVWVEGGMQEGDGVAPVAPVYTSTWQLGKPDLVLAMDTPLIVPAGGTDIFENFVLPTSVTGTRWVRAMEIRPGSPQVVHHANVIIDRTASLRRAHPADWRRGIPGMDILVDSGESFDPDSHFLFWKPDSTALIEPEGMPWRMDAGNDLVLNMHLKPTGKVETVQAQIGLYFTEKPATGHPMLLQLEHDAALDIPAGAKAFVVEDTLKLPVAVEVLAVYPHAHYLAKKMEGWAMLPNGERRWLVLIEDWDIDRQSVYRLVQPLPLPRGSVVHMRYTYDNSAGNVRNPNTPPIRVRDGNRSVDEMGHLWLQVLPKPDKSDGDPREALERAWMENRLHKNERDDVALYNLASLAMMEGKDTEALALYRRALEQRPDDVRTITSVGSALNANGDWEGARVQYRRALAVDPAYADSMYDLATLDLRHDAASEAEQLFRGLVMAHPEDVGARAGLGSACRELGRADDAKEEFEQVLAAAPDTIEALYGLASIAMERQHPEQAEPLLVRMLAVHEDKDGEQLLALVYAGMGAPERALKPLDSWQRLAPADPEPHRALAQVYNQLGRKSEALGQQRIVVKLSPGNSGDWNDLGVMEANAGDVQAARRALQHALELDPENTAVQANLRRF